MILITKKVATFIVGFVTGVVALYAWGQFFNSQETPMMQTETTLAVGTPEGNEAPTTILKNNNTVAQDAEAVTLDSTNVVVKDQQAGEVVSISSVNLSAGNNGGWVVVHEVKNGVIANALGAVRKDTGMYKEVAVKLLRGTVSGGAYAVVLYADNGDRQFNLSTDKPLKGADGAFIMSLFSGL